MENKLKYYEANCKLAYVPSGNAISAQPSVQANWHMPQGHHLGTFTMGGLGG